MTDFTKIVHGGDLNMLSFHSSIGFDWVLYQQDIEGSKAHAKVLVKAGILTIQEQQQIEQALTEIQEQIAQCVPGAMQSPVGTLFSLADEDIHMGIERLLTEKVGALGKKLHTGRSRNDQVATDIKLYLRQQLTQLQQLVGKLIQTLTEQAQQHAHAYMPVFTHLQKAQASTYGHWLLAYAQMFKRDYIKFGHTLELLDTCPLGSAALCGTTYPLDRHYAAELLGFAGPTESSLDGVADRDHIVDALYNCSLVMMHLSRYCEELIVFSSSDFGYVKFSGEYSTGSSIMPQKKNPDAAELIRGKTGRVYGALTSMLTVLKGLTLAYNKDLQEDKEALFDALDTTKACVKIATLFTASMQVNVERLRQACATGYIGATDVADYLVKKHGLPFRQAYGIVGALVNACIKDNKVLEDCDLLYLQQFYAGFDAEVFKVLDVVTQVEGRKTYGGPAAEAVKQQTENMFAWLAQVTK